jgi:hypothetical protein
MLTFRVERAPIVKNCKINSLFEHFSRLFGAKCVYSGNPNQVGAATPTATPIGAHRPLKQVQTKRNQNIPALEPLPSALCTVAIIVAP